MPTTKRYWYMFSFLCEMRTISYFKSQKICSILYFLKILSPSTDQKSLRNLSGIVQIDQYKDDLIGGGQIWDLERQNCHQLLMTFCEFCFRILALSSLSVRPSVRPWTSVTWAFMPIYIDFCIDASKYFFSWWPDQTRPWGNLGEILGKSA